MPKELCLVFGNFIVLFKVSFRIQYNYIQSVACIRMEVHSGDILKGVSYGESLMEFALEIINIADLFENLTD